GTLRARDRNEVDRKADEALRVDVSDGFLGPHGRSLRAGRDPAPGIRAALGEDLGGAISVLQSHLVCARGPTGTVVEVHEEPAVDLHPAGGIAVDLEQPRAQSRVELV